MRKSLRLSLRRMFVSLFLVLYIFVPTLGITDVFAGLVVSYNGSVNGFVGANGSGVVSGSTTGAYNTTISGSLTGINDGQWATFNGTMTGDIVGSMTGGINWNGFDTLSARITVPGLSGYLYLIGYFEGTTGQFVADFITTDVPIVFSTAVNITGPSTVSVEETVQFTATTDGATQAVKWTVWTNPADPNRGNATIDEATGLLTGVSMGPITVIASTLDGSLVTKNYSVTIVDTTAPSVPVLLFPTNNQFINSQDLYIDWADSTDNVTIPGNISYQYRLYSVDPNIFPSASFYGVTYSGTTRHPLAGFASGTGEHEYWYTLQAVDELGNESGFGTPVKFTVDNTTPTIPTGIYFKDTYNDKNLQCGDLTNTRHLDVYWDAILGDPSFSHYEYSSFNAPSGSAGLVERRFDTNYFNSSWWTVPIEGVYGVQLRSVDKAGNKSLWYGGTVGVENSCQFIVDWTNPTGSIDGIKYPNTTVQDKFITNLNTPVIVGSANDDNGVKNVKVKIGDYLNTSGAGGPGFWEAGFSNPIPDGTYTIELTIEDLAGNITTITKDITIDTVVPFATHTYFKNGTQVTEDIAYVKGVNELTFTGVYTDTDPSSGLYWDSFVIFEAQDDGSFGFSANGKQAFCGWRNYPNLIDLTTYAGETFNFTDCVNTLADGNYYMAHHIYDNATRKDIPSINQFRDVLGLNFVVDNVAPITTFTTDYSGMTFGGDIHIEGISTDDNAIKILYIQYKESSSSTWEDPYEFHSGWGEKSYAWDTWWGPTEDGHYDIKAYATDLAGNIENSAYMYNIGFDRTAPQVRDINITFDYLGMYINGTTGFMVTAPVRDNLSGIDGATCKITTDSNFGTNGTWNSGTYIRSLRTCMFTIGSQPDNKPLYINVSVSDNVGNTGYGNMVTRTSDSALPTGGTDIEDNFYGPNGNTLEINGTADDTVSGVNKVSVSLRRSSDNKYWLTSSTWIRNIFPLISIGTHDVLGTTEWSLDKMLPGLQNGISYTITPYIWDNVHTMYGTGTSDSFIWDSQAPQDPTTFDSSTHIVDKPSSDNVVTVSFSGAHDFGLSGVKGYYYNFSQTQETPNLSNWLEFDDTTVSSNRLRDGIYYFNIRTVDMVGNMTSTAHFGPFIIDTTPATITWDEPLNGSIVATPVTLKTSTDETMKNVRFIWKYEDEAWNTGANNNSNQTEYEYVFNPTEDGTYRLRVQGRDLALNWSRAVPDITIIVDNTAPVLSGITDFSLLEGDNLEPIVTDITELNGISEVCLNIPAYSYEMCDDTVDPLITEYNLMQFVIDNLSVTTVDTSILPIGIHTVEYYAYDIVGNKSNVMSTDVEILDNTPFVSILGVTSTNVGTQVTLSTSVTDGNPLFEYLWSGDCIGTEATTTFTPSESRDYICTIQVTDEDGDTTTETHTVSVGAVLGTTDDGSGSSTTPQPSSTLGTNGLLGTGGGDYIYAQTITEEEGNDEGDPTEEEEDIEEEDKDEDKEDVKGLEDEDTEGGKTSWVKYLLLTLPVFILLFLILKRRKEEEERQY